MFSFDCSGYIFKKLIYRLLCTLFLAEYLLFGLSSDGPISASHKLHTSGEISWRLNETEDLITQAPETEAVEGEGREVPLGDKTVAS